MVFPATPQDVRVRMFLGGTMVDVTTDVREASGLDIEHGQSGQGSQAQASTCSLTLGNADGRYSPRNPTGPYYGELGRNTPLEVTLGDTANDAFGRTSVNTWGTADIGGVYTSVGAGGSVLASDFQVAAGKGTHSVPVASAYRWSYLPVSVRDCYAAVTCTVTGVSNVTGGNLEPANMTFRHDTGTGAHYRVEVLVLPDETVKVGFQHTVEGIISTYPVVPGLTYSGQALRVAVLIEGSTFRARVWAAAGDEPAGWHVTGYSTLAPTAGRIGIRSGRGTGNTNTSPVVFSYDDFEVRIPRFYGEVSDWPLQSDVTDTDVTVSITASGSLRRLGRGQPKLKSPIYRNISTTAGVLAYWPMEDGRNADRFGSALGGPPLLIQGDIRPATNTDFECSEALPVWGSAIGPISGEVPAYTDTGFLRASVLVKMDVSGYAADNHPLMSLTMAGSGVATWSLETNINGRLRLRALSATGAELANSGNVNFGVLDGHLLMVMVELDQDGADIDWSIIVYEVGGDTGGLGFGGTLATQTLGTAQRATLGGALSLNNTITGHLHLAPFTYSGTLVVPVLDAHAGETAVARITRLCTEEGVPFTLTGATALSEPMGVQDTQTLLDLVEDAADTDGGYLADPRGCLGIAYRTRVSLYGQSAELSIDYAANQLVPSFAPVDDDRYTKNVVTVNRRGGTSYTDRARVGALTPELVGTYEDTPSLSLATDTQVPHQATWRVHMGTVDEPRYPHVGVDLAKFPALRAAALNVDIGYRLDIVNPPSWLPPDTITLLAQGYTEQLSRFRHRIGFGCVPESPYRVVVLDSDTWRLDSATTTLNEDLTTTETGVDVAIGDGVLWTTTSGEWPFDIIVGGEIMRVTAVSGASSPQTFTVTRSINGVVKTHATGARVQLAYPPILAL